jgi:hypothetical protein
MSGATFQLWLCLASPRPNALDVGESRYEPKLDASYGELYRKQSRVNKEVLAVIEYGFGRMATLLILPCSVQVCTSFDRKRIRTEGLDRCDDLQVVK